MKSWAENSIHMHKSLSITWKHRPRQIKQRRRSSALLRLCVTLMAFSAIFISATSQSWAAVKDADAVRAIVGEAENQGYRGMLAVAEGIRNRGHLRGVYGLKRDLSKTPKKRLARLFEQAKKAWEESKNTNLVKGADHWENVKRFGVPSWAPKMNQITVIGDHTFYRRMRS